MNRNEYIRRILPVISPMDNEIIEYVMDNIAKYLVDAGEENEEAAIKALGSPEELGNKMLETAGKYEIAPYEKPAEPPTPRKDVKKMIIVLGILVITSPLWVAVVGIAVALTLIFEIFVFLLLILMSVGGVAFTVLGVIRLLSVVPVGLVFAGSGLLLLGIAGIAFFPLLRGSIRFTNYIVYKFYYSFKYVFDKANTAEVKE